MVVDLDTIQMIVDSTEAGCSPIIKVNVNGKEYNLNEEEFTIHDNGDTLIFEIE